MYYAHRLAWFYLYEKWPDESLDHKDGNKSNNSQNNLREANRAEQQFNRPDRKCYYYDKVRNRYRPLIQIGGKKIYGPSCKTEDEAIALSTDMKIKHHGEFYYG
ncbi:hypothetical protein D3C87_1635970 [compost metagenome]